MKEGRERRLRHVMSCHPMSSHLDAAEHDAQSPVLYGFLVLLVLRLSSPVPCMGLLLIVPGLVNQGVLREQGLDLDEDRGDGHAL